MEEDTNIHSIPVVPLASEYLRARGLQPEEVIALGGRFLDSVNIVRNLGWQGMAAQHYIGGLWLPGRDTQGAEDISYGHAVIWTRPSFGGVPIRKRFCPAGANAAVFMPVPEAAGGSWANLNPDRPVIICESWIKAAVAFLCGFAAIALNGVDGWSAGNRTILDSLTGRRWATQRVAVVFDTLSLANADSAANVARARHLVQSHMHASGARVMDIQVGPPPAGVDSWGLDDWVAVVGRAVFAGACAAAREMDERELNLLSAACADLNARYAYVRSMDRVVSLTNASHSMNVGHFCNAEAPLQVQVGDRRVSAAMAWVKKYPGRRTADRLCWQPTHEVASRIRGESINLWNGLAAVAAEPADRGEAEWYWLAALREIFPDGCDELLDILALMVQRPGVRVGRYIFVTGKPGTGKSYIFSLIERLLAGHCVRITPERYAEKFNMELAAARMIYMPEVPARLEARVCGNIVAELKLEADTAPGSRRLEPKGGEIVTIERNALVVMLSNHTLPWDLEDGDRRALILRSSDHMALRSPDHPWGTKGLDYWQDCWDWAATPEALSQVLMVLLTHPVDMARLAGPPTQTAAKRELEGRYLDHGWEGWARKVVHHPEPEWEVGLHPYVLTRQLCRLKHMGGDKPYEYKMADGRALGQYLRSEGVMQLDRKRKINKEVTNVWLLRGSSRDDMFVKSSVEWWDNYLTGLLA